MRLKSLSDLLKIGFDGYAIGGLAVGDTQSEMFKVLDYLKNYLPIDKPRYLMGVGMPSDILGAVKRGVDMFDCVLPTRLGRNGIAFTWKGKINTGNSKFKRDNSPLDPTVRKFDLNKYSKNYLNHLFNTNEMLASMILTLNNINFYQELMYEIRKNIKSGSFSDFITNTLISYKLRIDNRKKSLHNNFSYGPLAQLVEQFPFKEWVVGSNLHGSPLIIKKS